MIYFDYDGVIGNTEDGLFDEYERQKEYLEGLTRIHGSKSQKKSSS